MHTTHRAARRAHLAAVAVAALLPVTASLLGAACSPSEVEPVSEVTPAGRSPEPTDPAGSGPSAPPAEAPVDPTTTAPTAEPSPGGAPTSAAAALVEQVDLVLARYDAVLSGLAADPAAASRPEDPLRAEWDAAVVAQTALSEGMLGDVRRAGAEGTRLLPDGDGRSYRHRALHVIELERGRWQFTWCGYSPGVRVRATGEGNPVEVVDATVGHAHGVGETVDLGAGWQLSSLDQLELAVLDPGAADPCAAEQHRSLSGAAR